MIWKSHFGMTVVLLAAWFALGISAYADATFDGCTFYSRAKVSGGSNSGPYVDVGFMPKGNTSIDAKYRMWDNSANGCLFCARKDTTASTAVPSFTYFTQVGGKPRWDYNGTQCASTMNTSLNPNYRLIIERGTAKLYTTFERAVMNTMTVSSATFSGAYRMYLFSSYVNYGGFDNGPKIYFYYLKIYDGPIADGKLLHHYVPCKTASGAAAIADLVDEKVFTPGANASNLTMDESDAMGGVRSLVEVTGYRKSATFTASGYAGTEVLEEFPTLVRVSEGSPSGFSYGDCADDGSDIRFSDEDGHLLAHEIDTWNPTGESLIWVGIPKLTKGAKFKMYIGGDSDAAVFPASSVWRRAGYRMVNHNQVTAKTSGFDSAGNAYTVTEQSGSLAVKDLEGAPLGKVEDQTNNNGWNVADDAKWRGHGGQVTMSCWTYRTDGASDNSYCVLMGAKDKYVLSANPQDGKGRLQVNGATSIEKAMPVAAGTWMMVSAVLNGTDHRLYQNGVLVGTGTSSSGVADVSGLTLGCGSSNLGTRNKGYLDEWRFRWDSSTADWVQAEYDTVKNAAFVQTTGFVSSGGHDPEDWEYSFDISLGAEMKSAIGSVTESSFPILVRLSEDVVNGFKYSDFSQPDCSDLVFVDSNGALLDYEIDTWDTTGVSLVWVRVPKLSAKSIITCRYRGPAYSHAPSKTWKKFVAVVHGGASGITNSAPSGLTVTAGNTVVTDTGSKIGGGINKAAKSSIGVNVQNPYSAGKFTNNRRYSVMSWTKPAEKSNMCHYGGVSAWGGACFMGVFEQGNYLSIAVSSTHQFAAGKGVIVAGQWQHTAFSYDTQAGALKIFCDGELALNKTDAKTYTDAGVAYWTFGSYANNATGDSYRGEMDELRIYDGLVSEAWMKSDYCQVQNASAFTYGKVMEPDPEMPKLDACTAEVNSNGNIIVSGEVARHSGEVTVTMISEGHKTVVLSLGEIAAGEAFSREVSDDDGLVKFATYTVSVIAANGEKVAGKTVETPVKYGKVSMSDFEHRFDVTIPDGFTGSPLKKFPVLVRISTAIPCFEYSQFSQAGKDLLAFANDGTPLPCELENYDVNGVSRFWVEVPLVTNGVSFAVCYGVNEAVPQPKMWTEYASVLHLNSSAVTDSTGNAVPSVNAAAAIVEGYLGNGCSMGSTTGKNGAAVVVPISEKLDECNGVFTASAWTKLNAAPAWGYLMSRKVADSTASWGLQFRGGSAGDATSLAFSTAGNSDGESVSFKTLSCFKTGNWVKWTAVYNGVELSLYTNGVKFATQTTSYGEAVNGTQPLAIGGFATATGHATLPAVFDEARVKVGAVSDDWVIAEYKQETVATALEYGEVGPADPNAPVLGEPIVVPNGDGTFAVTVIISDNMPKEGSVKIDYNDTVTVLSTTDISVPAHFNYTLVPAMANTTDVFTVRAKSALGGTRTRTSSGFYNGEIRIEKILDATEKGLSNGYWRITRGDDNYVLKLAFDRLASSTAVPDVDYYDFPMSAEIPAGAKSVEVPLQPKMNLERDEDTWVDLALSNGAYRVDSAAASARLTIKNYVVPAGGNIWCAETAGKASDGSNWTKGHAPQETEIAVFDGDISTADCEWDSAAAHRLAGWTQNARYTGTITIATTFGDAFPKLRIDGDMLVSGGRITHKAHDDSHKVDVYRLALDIKGMLTIGDNASFTARALGSYGPRSEGQSCYGGGYNGARSWGSLTEPNAVGSSANDNGTYTCFGGGAIWIEVGGVASVNGPINANGIKAKGMWDTHAGSGGSVYLKCAKLLGTGKISANCENVERGSNARSGAGGRVSVVLTDGELDNFAYTQFDTRAGWPSYANHGGTGTVLVRSPDNPNGILYLRDAESKYNQYGYRVSTLAGYLTDIPAGETWTLDGIVFGHNAVLRVPSGTVLSLPNGLDSVSSDAVDYNCGIIVDGGELVLPERDQVMSGLWTLTSRNDTTPTEVRGDLTLKNGANIGSIVLHSDRVDSGSELPLYGKTRLKIDGDLFVDATATMIARDCGLKKYANTLLSGHKGILQGHTHGGRVYAYKSKDAQLRMYTAYDSVFSPSLPGNAVPWPNGQGAEQSGGVITLDIGGKFTMNGKADVSGNLITYVAGGNCSGGTGGSIDITAGSIAGTGKLLADGGAKQDICGPGGRIAVKLTDAGADFSAFTGRMSASGRIVGSNYANASSAGTVFLRTGDDVAKGGTIRIAMSDGNGHADNPSTTEILSQGFGGDAASDLKSVGLELLNYGAAAVNADLQMSWVKFVGGSTRLDFEGHQLIVNRAWVNGNKIPVGTYEVGSAEFGDLLVDSVGGGSLRVTGYGLWVFIQ